MLEEGEGDETTLDGEGDENVPADAEGGQVRPTRLDGGGGAAEPTKGFVPPRLY